MYSGCFVSDWTEPTEEKETKFLPSGPIHTRRGVGCVSHGNERAASRTLRCVWDAEKFAAQLVRMRAETEQDFALEKGHFLFLFDKLVERNGNAVTLLHTPGCVNPSKSRIFYTRDETSCRGSETEEDKRIKAVVINPTSIHNEAESAEKG